MRTSMQLVPGHGRADLTDTLLAREQPARKQAAPSKMRGRTVSWDEVPGLLESAQPKTIGRGFNQAQGASFRSTVFNLMSTCLGSGM